MSVTGHKSESSLNTYTGKTCEKKKSLYQKWKNIEKIIKY
jgi:hypothetical protein